MKYQVEVREQLNRIVVVEAPDEASAIERVNEAYNNSEIVLDSNDLAGEKEIEVLEDSVPEDFSVDYTVEAKDTMRKTEAYTDKILELIEHKDELTQSDLQGAVSAIVRQIIKDR